MPIEKAPGAFRTIGELSAELGVAQHILRYWETRFPQLKPLQRAGNRRYYRAADVDLARRIHRLLNQEGYTVRGVQKLLQVTDPDGSAPATPDPLPDAASVTAEVSGPAEASSAPEPASEIAEPAPAMPIARLIALRDRLAAALEA
jgi:DNA-binding transcriptional MerR regulator